MKRLILDYIGESTSMGYCNGTDHADDSNYCVPLILQEALTQQGFDCTVSTQIY
jgi:hypothetical protein